MFGPNAPTRLEEDVSGHHRDEDFSELLLRLGPRLRRATGLAGGWDVLVLTGSGTFGLEAAAWSLRERVRPPAARGTFTRRLAGLLAAHGKSDPGSPRFAEVALDTSTSSWADGTGAALLDAVSSFPYHPIPAGVDVFVTVSSKQLGGPPVLAIVGVRADAWERLRPPQDPSILNLARHAQALGKGQPLHTPAMPLLADMDRRLASFDLESLRARIRRNGQAVADALGPHRLVGDTVGPVLSVPKRHIPLALAQRYRLYGLRTEAPNYSVFTYSGRDEAYARFAEDLQGALAVTPAA